MTIPSRKKPAVTPAVSITNNVYSMASSDGVSAEITLYGDIYEQTPTDWYGNPIEGQFISLEEFLKDLKQIEGCKEITVRMNSYGGDAGVSLTIPITNGHLNMGTWQGIYFCEYRNYGGARDIVVTIIGE